MLVHQRVISRQRTAVPTFSKETPSTDCFFLSHFTVVGFLVLLLPACSDFSCPKMANKKTRPKSWWRAENSYGGFLKWWYTPTNPWVFLLKNDHFGVLANFVRTIFWSWEFRANLKVESLENGEQFDQFAATTTRIYSAQVCLELKYLVILPLLNLFIFGNIWERIFLLCPFIPNFYRHFAQTPGSRGLWGR